MTITVIRDLEDDGPWVITIDGVAVAEVPEDYTADEALAVAEQRAAKQLVWRRVEDGFSSVDLDRAGHLAAAVSALHADLSADPDMSSNDMCQVLDEWFVEQGFPTVIYSR